MLVFDLDDKFVMSAHRFFSVEAYCEAKGHKKSPLIVRLIREHLDREGFSSQPGLFDPAKMDPPKKQKQTKAAQSGPRDGESRS